MMPITIVARVKTAPIIPKTMGIVSVSKVLVLDAGADAELASAVWVALAVGPEFARSMFGEVKLRWGRRRY
jgi:hypothetical protein